MKRALLIAAVGVFSVLAAPSAALADLDHDVQLSVPFAPGGHDQLIIGTPQGLGVPGSEHPLLNSTLDVDVDVSGTGKITITNYGGGIDLNVDGEPVGPQPNHTRVDDRCELTDVDTAECTIGDLDSYFDPAAGTGAYAPVYIALGPGDDDLMLGGVGGEISSFGIVVSAGDGNDSVVGGPEQDFIGGYDGHDYLVGGGGRDQLRGEAGNDVLKLAAGDNDWPSTSCGADSDLIQRDTAQGLDNISDLASCEYDAGIIDVNNSQPFSVPQLYPGLPARVNYVTQRSVPNATSNDFKICKDVTVDFIGMNCIQRDPGFDYQIQAGDVGKYLLVYSCPKWKVLNNPAIVKTATDDCWWAAGYVHPSPELAPVSRPAPPSTVQPKLGQGIETAGPLAMAIDSIAKTGVVKSYRVSKGQVRLKTSGAPGTPGAKLTVVLSVIDAKGKAVRLAAVKMSLALPSKIVLKLSSKSRKLLKKAAGKQKKVKGTLKLAATAPNQKSLTRTNHVLLLP
jgi:hypothetical protein